MRYFESLGFRNMGFSLADETQWTDQDLKAYDRQLGLVREYVRDNWYRKGIDRRLGAFDALIKAHLAAEQAVHECGTERDTVPLRFAVRS